MSNALMNSLIVFGITSAICYGLMTRAQNRSQRRSRAVADGDSYSGTSDGFTFASWFSSDHSSGDPVDSGSSGDGGGGDGGGDGGGGGD
jgi:hypothetical protein